jgi:hypothetical protein
MLPILGESGCFIRQDGKYLMRIPLFETFLLNPPLTIIQTLIYR